MFWSGLAFIIYWVFPCHLFIGIKTKLKEDPDEAPTHLLELITGSLTDT